MSIVVREYGRGHTYHVDGQKYDGVTTLIKDGVPKPALVYWAARTVAEFVADSDLETLGSLRAAGRGAMVAALKEAPWTARDNAAAKGTEVHTYAEKLTAGDEVEVPEHLAGHVEACVAFLDRHQVTPLAIEVTVANRRWRYAGTADLFAELTVPKLGRVRACLDWKTGASGVWPEAALQVAAYRHAECYVDAAGAEQPMADLDLTAGYAVWLRADGYDLVPLETGEDVFRLFTHIAYVARRMKDSRAWVGAAIQPEAVDARA